MRISDLYNELYNARDYLFHQPNSEVDPEIIIFVESSGTALQMDEIEVSINGNCIQLMVK